MEVFLRRRSSELKGLKKLMPAGTFCNGPPARHGKAAGQASGNSTVDHGVELIAVLDLAADGVARKNRQARAGMRPAKGVGRNTGAEGVNRRKREAPGHLHEAVQREPVALVSDRVAFFEAQIVDALDEIDLFIHVVVGELIVIGDNRAFSSTCS